MRRTAVASVGAALLAACGGPAEPPRSAPAPIPITLAVARVQTVAAPVVATGPLRYERQETLAFKTPGVIARMLVDQGDLVARGQTLAELDPTDVATVAAQTAGAAEQAAAVIAQATATLAQARNDLKRAEELFARGFASQARLDAARANLAAAEAGLEAARAGAVAARGARARARFDEGRARIVAPADGVVLARHREANETVAAGAPILTLGDRTAGLMLAAPVTDRDRVRVRLGDAATVRLSALPGQPIAGEVSEIAALADARTGAFDVEVRLAAAPEGAASGMIGQASIQASGGDARQALVIPAQALSEASGERASVFVFSPQAGTVRRRAITVGPVTPAGVVVLSGLSAGEQVAAAGAAYLRDGARAVPAAQRAAPAPR